MNDTDLAVHGLMRMRVLITRSTVGSPPRVTDTCGDAVGLVVFKGESGISYCLP